MINFLQFLGKNPYKMRITILLVQKLTIFVLAIFEKIFKNQLLLIR